MSSNQDEGPLHSQTKRKSLTQKYFLWLQPCEIWCLMRKRTSFKSTLDECIRSALDHPETDCGLYAPDGDCYELFRCLFWPVIMDYHRVDIRNLVFKHDFGDFRHLEDLPSQINERILFTRLRLSRSIQGYPMASKLTEDQFFEVEERIRSSLEHLDDDLQGEYHSLKQINDVDQARLRQQQLLFQVCLVR